MEKTNGLLRVDYNQYQIPEHKADSFKLVETKIKSYVDWGQTKLINQQTLIDTIKSYIKYIQDINNNKINENNIPHSYHNREINSTFLGLLIEDTDLKYNMEILCDHTGLKKILNYLNCFETTTIYTGSSQKLKDNLGMILEINTDIISVYFSSEYAVELSASYSQEKEPNEQKLITALNYFKNRYLPREYAKEIYNAILMLAENNTLFSNYAINVISQVVTALEDLTDLKDSYVSSENLNTLKIRLNNYNNIVGSEKFHLITIALEESLSKKDVETRTLYYSNKILEATAEKSLSKLTNILKEIQLWPATKYDKLTIAEALDCFIEKTEINDCILSSDLTNINHDREVTHLRYLARFSKFIELNSLPAGYDVKKNLSALFRAVEISKQFAAAWEKNIT